MAIYGQEAVNPCVRGFCRAHLDYETMVLQFSRTRTGECLSAAVSFCLGGRRELQVLKRCEKDASPDGRHRFGRL